MDHAFVHTHVFFSFFHGRTYLIRSTSDVLDCSEEVMRDAFALVPAAFGKQNEQHVGCVGHLQPRDQSRTPADFKRDDGRRAGFGQIMR
jgi:hypothetical protein